jgi:Ca2+-binding RTX toxin-like protein/subtilisin-like proprotein convertase family protein
VGDDIVMGGQDDDRLSGGAGNDVLKGEQGDDVLDGGDGTDFAEFAGSFADYRITKLDDATYRVVDTHAGRDGADILKNIEKLNFADVTAVDITLDNPLPVKDILTIADRAGLKLIKVSDLLANDRDWQGDALHITTISDVVGGTLVGTYNATTKEWTPTLTALGELQFTPDPNYTGVMSFKYKVADVDNTPGATAIIFGTTTQAEMRGQVFIKTPDMPTDSIFTDQWYLNDINVLPVWKDYTGKGVRIAQFETGMPFSTGPEVFDYRNPDLQPNVDQSWIADPNANITQEASNHATLVAGVMVAARNGEGAVGVAYDAKLSGHYIQGTGLEINALTTEVSNALATFKNYDVVNNSWGTSSDFLFNVLPQGTLEVGVANAVAQGRNGLGTAIVMAGGNDRQNGGNTNYNALTANRAVIVTGAINAQADISTLTIGSAPFSNPGASILVSAPGSNVASTSSILMNNDGSVFGNSTSTVQGTSFATPVISGVVALMLEANPNLGWRDIQQILALSARKVNDPNTDTVWNTANNWNGGGMHTSHDYGFGDVDARAAVRLAETWQGSHTSYNERNLANGEGSMYGGANLGIAIGDGAVVTRTLAIGAGLRAEHVDVSLDVTHTNWGDLTVELIAPSGTISKLAANPGTSATNAGGDVGTGRLTFTFDTTHSYGENAQGNWQLRITDRTGRGTGTLNGWKVDVYGSDLNETATSMATSGQAPVISAIGNNQYFYTDEFASTVTAPGVTRNTLTDTNGGVDIVNASAVSTGSTINLNNGTTSTIAGRNLTINGNVEWALGGDGNDTITGNALSNRLQGGRGNDVLNGGDGLDLLDGAQGNDTLTGGLGLDFFVIRKGDNSTETISDFNPATIGEKILFVGFDNVTDFTQIMVTQEGLNTRLSLGNGQSVLLLNIAPTQISEQNFGFVSDDRMLDTYVGHFNNTALWAGTSGVENGLLPTTYGDLTGFFLGGNDVIGSMTSNDVIDGGDGNDTIWGDYAGAVAPGADWLEGGNGNDTLYGGAGDDLLLGGSGNDNLQGDAGNDILRGATGADQLYGGDGNDVLLGGAGDDYIDGGLGNDVLFLEGDLGTVNGAVFNYYGTRVGGAGADVFKVTANGGANGGFTASGTQFSAYNLIADFDPTTVGEIIDLTELKWVRGFADLSIGTLILNGTPITRITATNGVNQFAINLRGVNSSAITAAQFKFATTPGLVFGGSGNDVLAGDAGGNTIDGGTGADAMTGRTGDDTYVVDNVGDTVNELPGGGFDTVKSSVTYTLSADVENLVLTGAATINATGNELANRLTGNAAANLLNGMGGVDTMLGGAGNDTYVVDSQADTVIEYVSEGADTVQASVSYTLGNNIENLQLTGIESINATGNDLVNTLTGNSSDNIIDGAAGADLMTGGLGDDTYIVDNTSDVVTENLNEGIDSVYAAVNYTLGTNVENLVLTPGAISGTGNASDNLLTGNSANNTLSGGAGNDWLDGKQGGDELIGGVGDDTYMVDSIADIVTENLNEGTDTVVSSIAYTLGANVENLTLTGTAALDGTGNTLNNTIIGNAAVNVLNGGAGNDTLDGGADADTLIGGTGNDTYVVNDIGDVVTETSTLTTEIDTVQSGITYTLGANVENLTLTGAAAINGTGNTLNNVLTGNTAANVLNGGTGADSMIGGTGNDTYVVDNAGDVVTEASTLATEIDTVQSGITYTLGANVENLTLTGAAAINGTGNTLNNVLTGNTAANVLNGGAGADSMIGGTGNDTYVVDNAGDVVTESSTLVTEIDTVQSGISYTLGANVENLTLTGAAAINGTGNALNNIITGNAAANTLNGGIGADTLIGGTGNDTYVVDNAGDVVTETSTLGTEIDSVQSSVTYTLSANVENLTLTGATAINGTGNTLNNIITGNAEGNVLNGGIGADTMVGGAGSDTYYVDNVGDVVNETSTVASEIDTVYSTISYALGANAEYLYLQGASAINGTGNTLSNVVGSNAGNNVLDGGAGGDWVYYNTATAGVTVDLSLTTAQNTIGAGVDTLSNFEYILGSAYNDNLKGNAAGNVLNGGAGDDTLDGGAGSDWVYYNTATAGVTVDLSLTTAQNTIGAGTDTLLNFEYIRGSAFNDILTGNALDNVFRGDAGDDIINGAAGSDWIFYDTAAAGVTVNLNLTTAQNTVGAGTDTLLNIEHVRGSAFNDILIGNAVSNALRGDAGNDSMDGGAGTDWVYYDTASSAVTVDLSLTTAQNTLGAGTDTLLNFENVYGSAYNDTLTGDGLANVVNGNAGADTLIGGLGNDTYVVDNAGDVVTETSTLATEIDAVQSSISYTLTANVENLALTGAAATNGTGNALNNTLTGNAAVNVLNGGVGADTMVGGAGNDTYYVDNVGDVVTENLNEGTDTVYSTISYALGANVEQLSLQGTSAINATGNALGNVIWGNAGDNVLDGGAGGDWVYYNTATAGVSVDLSLTTAQNTIGAGIDTLTNFESILGSVYNDSLKGNANNNVLNGGAGNDTLDGGAGSDWIYYNTATSAVTVDLSLTTAQNTIGAGIDTLSNFEYVYGSGYNDTLTGNTLGNYLDGNAGADTMAGGLGNDTYWVDNVGDVVTETSTLATEIDAVQSSISYTLGANVENLTLTGAAALNGTGNGLNNTMTGNASANLLTSGLGNDALNGAGGNDILLGGDGNDTLTDTTGNNLLDGGTGTDTLTGGAGNELFIGGTGNDTITTGNGADIIAFNRGDGMDTVSGGIGTDNTISLGKGINYADIALSKVNNNLILEVGAGEQITLTDWYNTAANYKSVIDLQVMADAMAAFDATSADPLLNQAVQNFDFTAIVNAFDQANGGSATFMHWSATNSLLTSHLSGSDVTAIGGDLAHQYGTIGTLTGMGLTSAQTALNDPQFGAAQTLRPLQGLQGGAVTL